MTLVPSSLKPAKSRLDFGIGGSFGQQELRFPDFMSARGRGGVLVIAFASLGICIGRSLVFVCLGRDRCSGLLLCSFGDQENEGTKANSEVQRAEQATSNFKKYTSSSRKKMLAL